MQLFRHAFRAMGSPCELQIYAVHEAAARRAALRGENEVRRLEAKYSRYRDDSLTALLQRSAGEVQGVEVDEETAGLLDYAEIAWRESDGLFDLTSGVLRRAWDFQSGQLPTPAQLEAVLSQVGWDKVHWKRPRLVLPKVGMELDFGGFVKEYAADSAARVVAEQGIAHGLVELGGDIRIIGPHPDGKPWQVGIRNPRAPEQAIAQVALMNGGIASSGDYERYMLVEGQRYCHILNPRTGWPVRGLASVSVVAEHCLIAGSAATVAMLKGRQGRDWLETLGLPYLAVDESGAMSGNQQVLPV